MWSRHARCDRRPRTADAHVRARRGAKRTFHTRTSTPPDTAAAAPSFTPHTADVETTDGRPTPAHLPWYATDPRGVYDQDATATAHTARRHGHPQLSLRWPAVAKAVTAAVAVAAFAFGAGFVAGARNPLLAPVRISAGTVPGRAAQLVYAAAKGAVVTISTNTGTLGSGFFYRPDRIVTNYHVVSGAAAAAGSRPGAGVTVQVRLADGRTRTATVTGVDERLDVAVLSVPAGLNVRPLAFADAFALTPGADAYAIGSPFGLATTITAGVVSGLDLASSFASDAVQSTLLQTDAAVNPGNSGGPLLDGTGAVLGVVTLRPDTSLGRPAQGLAFALPSNVVVAALDKIEKYGSNSHPQLGLYVTAPTADDKPGPGLLVGKASGDGSPAYAAGVRAGDRLLSIDNAVVSTYTDLLTQVIPHRAGDVVTLDLSRGGVRLSVDVKLREQPAA